MKDRVPRYPNRMLITPADGSAPYYATVTRADDPIESGTLIGKASLLKDATATLYGLGTDAVMDDVLVAINDGPKMYYIINPTPLDVTTLTSLSVARYDLAAATDGNGNVLFAGGSGGSTGSSAVVDKYSPSGVRTTLDDLSVA